MNQNNIIPIWQSIGNSTNQLALGFGQKYNTRASHTGTLDPMAEGVAIILTGDEVLKKHSLASWEKEYEFSICLGISTDTYDGLGLIQNQTKPNKITGKLIQSTLNTFIGKYVQTVPKYAAYKIKGKPIHWYAQNSINIELPKKSGIIKSLDFISLKYLSLNEISEIVINKINKVKFGDFRQKLIINQWENMKSFNTLLPIVSIKTKMTSGLYVRSLSQDIGQKLKQTCFVLDLVRTKNGGYTQQNVAFVC